MNKQKKQLKQKSIAELEKFISDNKTEIAKQSSVKFQAKNKNVRNIKSLRVGIAQAYTFLSLLKIEAIKS